MYRKIHEVATVIAGYTFRGAVTPDSAGSIRVFQAKDLVQGEPVVNIDALTRISQDASGNSGYLKKSDVLLVARGMRSGAFRSTVFLSDVLNVIASSSVHIIRVTITDVIPEYISHYLNSKEGQDSLSEIVSGSYIGAIPRKELENIKIPIPNLNKQQTIVDLHRNIREQQRILERKNEIKENIINATFKNLTAK